MARLNLPVHSYKLRSAVASPARLVNCYPEALPPDAKTRMILTRAPGITELVAPGNGPIRGLHSAFGDLFVVSGGELYRISRTGAQTPLGLIGGSGGVSMSHNTDYVVVVAEPNAYYSDGSTIDGALQITDPDFTARGAKYVKFVDNFMLFLEPDTGRFFWADLGSATSFDSLNFATAEGSPDNLVGIEVDHRQVLLMGEETGEIWQFDGETFVRAINGFFEIGCFNGDTLAKLDNSIFWLASDYTIRRLNGVTPQRVSTHAVEQFLTTVDMTTARAFSYTQDGHVFYVITFSTGCWAYDATTGEWAERASYPNDYYVWKFQASAHGREYVGDSLSNSVGYFDPTNYTENGEVQLMEWTYQPVYAENKRAIHDRLEIVLETGVGLVTGQGSDPEIMLEYSDDGGRTFQSLPNRKIGALGEYETQVVWNNCGSSGNRVYRGSISDPVKAVISDTILDARGGRV